VNPSEQRVRRTLLLALCILSAASACKPGRSTLSREQFVRANVALRAVVDSGPRGDSLRAAALRRAGVTSAQLRAYVQANARNTDQLAKAWEAIDDSLQARHQRRQEANPALRGKAMPPPSGAVAGPTGGAQGPPAPIPPGAAHGAPRQALPVNDAPPPAPGSPRLEVQSLPPASRPIPKRPVTPVADTARPPS
jgi:hypothetical protein